MRRSLFRVLAYAFFATTATATTTAADPGELRVHAAASLTDVVETLARAHEPVRVVASFGSSSTLARQIRDGAPADVYLGASKDWVEFLREHGRVEGAPLVFATNRLVCVGPERHRLAGGDAVGMRALAEKIGPQGRVGIADDGVPAGDYARAALEEAGVLYPLLPHLVGMKDVRAVLRAVEAAEIDVGFVYATDARGARVDVLFAVDPTAHPRIEYAAAVVEGTKHREAARSFLTFLQSEEARAILRDAGFSRP